MMATKPKPSNDTIVEEEETPQVLSTDDKQADIERRLAMLGVTEEPTVEEEEEEEANDPEPEPEAPPPVVEEVLPPEEEKSIPVPVMPAPAMTETEEPKVELPAVEPVQEKPPAVQAPVPASKSSKSALLARIMAAQERAKQAQMKQASQETTTSMEFEKDKMLRALNGITEEKPKQPPPMAFQPSPPPAVKQRDPNPPPPSFDMFEMQIQQKPMAPPPPPETFMAPPSLDTFMAPPVPAPVMSPVQTAPPAFDSLSLDIFEAPPMASAPTAPPAEAPTPDILENFGGIMPVPVAPPMVESEIAVDEVFGAELDGLGLSPEEKQKMIEEQRAIMEQIAKESSNQTASMAAIKADAFASRMTGSGPAVQSVDGFSASEVEEQRKILEQIEREKSSTTTAQKNTSSSSGQSVDIGGGQKVKLHGTEKTQESIDKGTASLVLCLNCNNWLQVAESATLMFCPICSVVSPVVKQDEIMSKEEILQMEEDRKLAERLQAEAYGDGDVQDYPANRRRATARATAAGAASTGEKSWWDTINNAMVSVGIASADSGEEKRSAEINARGAPGMYSVTTGEEGGERVGLLGGGGDDGDNYPMGRVAQGKPLFSCVVDSISNTANMISGADQDEVHGVDTTSFLATPNIGREKNDSSGSYYAVPE